MDKQAETARAEQLRGDINSINSTQFSPSVMQNKALLSYASDPLDSFFDIETEQIPFISFIRALNAKIPIPCTMQFIDSQLSLSRSKERKGRIEFGQALNRQPVLIPSSQGINLNGLMQQEEKPGFIRRLLNRKKDEGT
jgi:hypothetical protein